MNTKWKKQIPVLWSAGAALLLGGIPAGAQAPAAPLPETHQLGLAFAGPEAFNRYPHVRIAREADADRPAQLVLNDYLPPVGDQQDTGSCVGWSTAYYCYSYSVAKQMKLTPEQRQAAKFQFSPEFIWDQFNGGDREKGMHIYEAFDVLAKQGCATLQEMPWNRDDITIQPSDEAKARAAKFKARQTVWLFRGEEAGEPPDPEKMKTWLWETKTPFVIGIKVYDDFMHVPHDADFVYTPSSSNFVGGHAICIIGYDENKHAFRMINSWGEGWGDHGQLWLSEDYVKTMAHEGWAQRPGGLVARGAGGATQFVGMKHITLEPALTSHLKSR